MPDKTRTQLRKENIHLERKIEELQKEEKRLNRVIDRLHRDWLSAEAKYHAKLTKDLYLEEENVEWVVNNLGELGVKIGDNMFFYYKGRSLRYNPNEDPLEGAEGEGPIRWRHVYKREFGECIHPPPKNQYSYNRGEIDRETGRYTFGPEEDWKDLPQIPEGPKVEEGDG